MSSFVPFRSARLLSLALVLLLLSVPAAANWKGKTVEKDGITQIMNPVKAVAAPETLELKGGVALRKDLHITETRRLVRKAKRSRGGGKPVR